MIGAIFSQALREYLRARKILPWLLLTSLCYLFSAYLGQLQPGITAQGKYIVSSTILVYHIMALASAIYTTSIISQEVEQRTIVYLLTRPIPRPVLLLTRYLASVLVVYGIGVFGAVCSAAGSHTWSLLPHDLVAMLVGAFAYGGLFLAISLLFNRSMIICLLYAFGWEISVPSMPGEMYRLSIYSYLQSIANHPDVEINAAIAGLASPKSMHLITAWICMIIAIVGLAAFSAYWFQTHEFIGREDAE